MKMIQGATIEVHAPVVADIKEVARMMCALAKHTGLWVTAKFNGQELQASEHFDPEDVVENYYKGVMGEED